MHLQNTKPSFKAKYFYDINFVLCILLNGLRTILMSHFRWKKNQNVQYLQVFKIEVECKILHFMKPHLIYFKRYQMRFHKELTPLFYLQVNLCQKLLFLHQLIHNMTTDCSLNYEFSTWKLQAQNMLWTHFFLFWHSEQFMYTTCSELVIFM